MTPSVALKSAGTVMTGPVASSVMSKDAVALYVPSEPVHTIVVTVSGSTDTVSLWITVPLPPKATYASPAPDQEPRRAETSPDFTQLTVGLRAAMSATVTENVTS
jgi:hypothetical protein